MKYPPTSAAPSCLIAQQIYKYACRLIDQSINNFHIFQKFGMQIRSVVVTTSAEDIL